MSRFAAVTQPVAATSTDPIVHAAEPFAAAKQTRVAGRFQERPREPD